MESEDQKVQRLLMQLPEEITKEQVVLALKECGGDEAAALCKLWGLDHHHTTPEKCDLQKQWDSIREVCDAYDQKMDEIVKGQRITAKST